MWNKVLGIKSQDLWLKAEITDENSKHNWIDISNLI